MHTTEMAMAKTKYRDIDAYLADVAPEARRRINAVRKLVKAQVRDAQEAISYNIPSFKTTKVFMHVAAFKEHIGVYPPVRADKRLLQALKPYSNEKGNLRFDHDQPLPMALLTRIAKALALQAKTRKHE
jgi:uncharacterized protein YdhG (YjbR/CyaY superfamily)